ncbi:hypothetical protein SAMN05216167_103498 [Spirosoma endophyticum]|uniref:Uncharacterized protein n=1 Tax=Spirosoma endophyticum TaxID=662367 RepID=A0A1I1PXR6_9BACT|nr:hypothetical protein SAMN05216167_103498 [Spirosoma endophyticum]
MDTFPDNCEKKKMEYSLLYISAMNPLNIDILFKYLQQTLNKLHTPDSP